VLVEPTRYECDDDNEEASVSHAVGYLPGTEVVLAAAVNGKDDHRLLAHLAVAIARRQGGFIDLGALLPMPAPPDASALHRWGRSVTRNETIDRGRRSRRYPADGTRFRTAQRAGRSRRTTSSTQTSSAPGSSIRSSAW
jgi:Family of unknown function (DUF6368)